jgi:small-conductance mechanosensitive channel
VVDVFNLLNELNILSFLKIISIVLIILIIISTTIRVIEKILLKNARTKRRISNIEIFSKIFKYTLTIAVLTTAFFMYSGSLTGLGLFLGLFSAALGFALQRPITGIAAWIMIVMKRPFEIGDRVIVGDVKGDVVDVDLAHVHLREIGGTISSEEISGRIVMIPNYLLFEKNIVNYTKDNEFVMDQVITTVTYESNLDKGIDICLKAAKKFTKTFSKKSKAEPYVRTFFQPSGINVHVRYMCPTSILQQVSSEITQEIHKNIKKIKSVEIAYPHTEIVYHK